MRKDVLFHEQVHQVTSWQVLHDEVKVIRVLERAFKVDDPGIFFRDCKDITLLSGLDDLVFEDHL
jgi:hypothetical protein